MIITQVLQDTTTGLWAVVQTSDENENYFLIMGDKEFETEGEALEYMRSFIEKPTKPFNINLVRDLLSQYQGGEISLSRFVEILNETVFKNK